MDLINSIIGEEKYFNHTLKGNKHYFAGYLNLAQNNITALTKAYGEHFGCSGKNLIINDLDKITSLIDWDLKVKFLQQYLPIIDYLDLKIDEEITFEIKKDTLTKNLSALFKTVNSLRNFYSHYYHSPLTNELNNDFLLFLDETFVKVCTNVKKKRMKDDKTKQLLKTTLKDELQQLLDAKKIELLRKKEEGIKVSFDLTSMKNSVLNDAFKHLVQLDESGKKEIAGRHYTSRLQDNNKYTENGIGISMSGLLFLLSMFLTKKQNEDMRSRIFGFKGKIEPGEEISKRNNSFRNMATSWVFSYLSFKGMKKQLGNIFNKESILVQIVDELSKVPHEVYEALSAQKQEQFLEDMNEYIKDGNKKLCLEDSIVVHPVIRKRYEDKFNYFAIRYLDEIVEFPSLRFQVNVGCYVHDKRTKTIDGTNTETDRTVKEEIRAFGKLSDISMQKADYFTTNLPSDVSWEMYPNPSYSISANNIPVYIDMSISRVQGAAKIGNIHKTKQDSLDLDKEGKKRERNENKPYKHEIAKILFGDYNFENRNKKSKLILFEKPTALLSLNELPALLYEVLSENGDKQDIGKRIEDKIVEKIVAQYNLISEYDGTTELPTSIIPKKLKKSEGEDITNLDKLLRAVKREQEITGEKLDLIRTNQKKFKSKEKDEKGKVRQHVFYTNELGQEATWIANDIKRFMPEDVRKQWRGYHHSNLQKLLSQYNQSRNEAVKCITCFWNFDQQTPWGKGIKEAFYKSEFEDFYKAYLDHRMEVYKTLENDLVASKDHSKLFNRVIKNAFILFDKHLYKIPSTDKLKERLMSTLFILPRGIFDAKPTFIKDVKFEDDPSQFADWYQFANASSHDFQSFYNLQRSYTDIYEEAKKNSQGLKENKKGLSAEEQLNFFKMRQDMKIKKIKIQDMFLYLIVKDLYSKVFGHTLPADIGLKKMYQTPGERQANYDLAVKQSQRVEGDKSDNLYNYNFLWNMTVPFEKDKIKEPQIKLKDIGKFYKFIADEKTQTILSYSDKVWCKLDLERELELLPTSYEVIRREQLLRDIQRFEKHVLESYPSDGNVHPKDFEKNKKTDDGEIVSFPNFNFYLLKGVIIKNNLASEEERQWFEKVNLDKTPFYPEVATKSPIIQNAYLLLLIRNKMLHNQLPCNNSFKFMTTLYPFQGYESYSAYFLFVTEKVIESLNPVI